MILHNKTIIVTGVGPGMGGKLCLQAAAEGANVVLAARSSAFIQETAAAIHAAGGKALAVSADVGKPDDCARVVSAAQNAFGNIYGLVNSAYRPGTFTAFETADLDDWRASMEVTLFGALRMVQAVLPSMKANGGGSIVNISTQEVRRPLAEHGSYNVPKAALQAATRQLALELGRYNIRVNNAVIGWMWGSTVETHMSAAAKESGVAVEQMVARIAATIPLGRIPPDGECAKSVLMLLSDYSSQVTGAALDVNGGDFLAL
jgi:NAD(P)-dependent dehydrogenase (short-subunit alcohol dehydrogenase family)